MDLSTTILGAVVAITAPLMAKAVEPMQRPIHCSRAFLTCVIFGIGVCFTAAGLWPSNQEAWIVGFAAGGLSWAVSLTLLVLYRRGRRSEEHDTEQP